jgi:hypothetical protein
MGTNNPDLQHKFVHTKNKRLRKCANCSFKNVKTNSVSIDIASLL